MLALFFAAAALGLAFCAPPGTVAAEALRRGLARGFRPALLVELGSLCGDAVWAAIALTGAAFLVQNTVARIVLSTIGGLILARLSWHSLRDGIAGSTPRPPSISPRGDLVTGVTLSLTNPLTVGFWVGVGGGAVQSIVPRAGAPDFIIFFVGFMIACIVWSFFYAGLIAFGRQLLLPAVFRAINLLCGAALAYFAVVLLLGVLREY